MKSEAWENPSGILPVEYKILIKPDDIDEKTLGGIIKADDTYEREKWAQVKGTLVAKGGAAFGEPFTDQERENLVPGARIYFKKNDGIVVEGADGEEYRLCVDKDIGGLILNEMAVPRAIGRKPRALSGAA